MSHEFVDHFLFGLLEFSGINGVVFNNIDQVGRYLAIYLYQFIGILEGIIEILEQYVFESDLVACLFVKIIVLHINEFDNNCIP